MEQTRAHSCPWQLRIATCCPQIKSQGFYQYHHQTQQWFIHQIFGPFATVTVTLTLLIIQTVFFGKKQLNGKKMKQIQVK